MPLFPQLGIHLLAALGLMKLDPLGGKAQLAIGLPTSLHTFSHGSSEWEAQPRAERQTLSPRVA